MIYSVDIGAKTKSVWKKLSKWYWLSLPVAIVLAVVGYHVARPVLLGAGWYLVLFNPFALWVYMLLVGVSASYLMLIWKFILAIPGVPKLRDRLKAWLHRSSAP